jgi:hypothetical protein
MHADLIEARARMDALDFRHGTIREVVYEHLSPPRRLQLHAQLGEALEPIYGVSAAAADLEPPYPTYLPRPLPPPERTRAEAHAAELAVHFDVATPLLGPDPSICYHYMAGCRLRSLCAHREALAHLATALALLQEKEVPTEADLDRRGHVVSHLAPTYVSCNRPEAAVAILREHLTACEQLGYARGVACALITIAIFAAMHPSVSLDTLPRKPYARALAVCESHGLEDLAPVVRAYLALDLHQEGSDPERAEAIVRSCLEVPACRSDPRLFAHLCLVLIERAIARRDWEEAEDRFRVLISGGGLLSGISLKWLLTHIETMAYETGSHERFLQLCDRMTAEYARAARTPPVQFWYPKPAQPVLIPGVPVLQEEFLDPAIHPALTWHDPTGRSRYECGTPPGTLRIFPAPRTDLWPLTNLDAPRLLTPMEGDYILEVQIEPCPVEVHAGLLVWRDENHFARLELLRIGSGRAHLVFDARNAGPFDTVGTGLIEPRPTWLRIERIGDEVRTLLSADRTSWLTAGSFRLPRVASLLAPGSWLPAPGSDGSRPGGGTRERSRVPARAKRGEGAVIREPGATLPESAGIAAFSLWSDACATFRHFRIWAAEGTADRRSKRGRQEGNVPRT